MDPGSVVNRLTEDSTTAGKQVLVVDDNPDVAKLVRAYLKGTTFSVKAAYSGTEALRSIEEERPAVILLDIMMPDLDGFEVAHRLYEQQALIPIVIFSVRDLDPPERQLLVNLGVKEFLVKDETNGQTLVNVLRRCGN